MVDGRILTTHVGSLPRPQDVIDIVSAEDRGELVDRAKYDALVLAAVRHDGNVAPGFNWVQGRVMSGAAAEGPGAGL